LVIGGPCNGTNRTRTFIESTNGGRLCTADEKIITQTCNNCIVTDWSACNGTNKTRTFTEGTNGGRLCTAYEKIMLQFCAPPDSSDNLNP